MSVIVAFQTQDTAGNPVSPVSQQRKNGMIALGHQIGVSTNEAESPNDYAAGLAHALQFIIDGDDGAKYRVVFQQLVNAPEFEIKQATRPGNGTAVHCTLSVGGAPLIINVQTDEPGQPRHMKAVFPLKEERNHYVYVADAAKDITELTAAVAGDYLMAFKFLGRCK
jgi:hypothetical protein